MAEINKNANKDPEFLGKPMVLTDVISNHPKRDNTKGIITAKTKPKIPIEAAFAKNHFFQLTSGNFLQKQIITTYGIVRKTSMCIPTDKPVRQAINNNHRLAYSSVSTTDAHFNTAQKAIAVKQLDIAYTSPSTAENQNESLNVKAKDPTKPEPIRAIF